MPTPFFSVMVPTYNQAGYLDACLASLAAQSDPDWEAVVVDDGSTDETPRVLAAWAARDARVRVLRRENGGTAAALNTALENCRGGWVCWLSSDDLFEPDKLEVHRRAMAARPDIRFFHTHFHYLEEATGQKTAPPPWRPIPEPGFQVSRFFSGNYVSGITVCVERQALREAGPFRTDLRHGQDFALWLELSRRTRSHYSDRRTAVTRWHAGQATNAFPVAGLYDSAWACLELLNAKPFEALFPALDLDDPAQALAAVEETLAICLDTGAFVYQMGYTPALVQRFAQWARDPRGGPTREAGQAQLRRAAGDPGLAAKPRALREIIRDAAAQAGPVAFIPEPVVERIRRTIASPETDPGKRRNLIAYLDQKNRERERT